MSIDSLKLIAALVLFIVVVVGFWQFCKRLSTIQVFLNFGVLFVVSYFTLDYTFMLGAFEALIGIVLWRKEVDEYDDDEDY